MTDRPEPGARGDRDASPAGDGRKSAAPRRASSQAVEPVYPEGIRLLVVLLAGLLALAVPAASTPAAERCGASIPDSGDQDCDGKRTDGAGGGTTDNCPTVKNAEQLNTDGSYSPTEPAAADGSAKPMAGGDGAGDACDDDDDADAVVDAQDNCPRARNPDQLDSDGDGRGDAPDGTDLCPRTDVLETQNNQAADGVLDDDDNCPTIHNPDQADLDDDRLGDACEYDDDGDNVADGEDNCPGVQNGRQADGAQQDKDGDGIGTACDTPEIQPAETPGFTPDREPPAVRVTGSSRRAGGEVRGRLPTAVSCSEACELTATLRYRGATRGTATARLGEEGRTWLFFRFRRGAIARIPRSGTRATLEVVATDAAGNRARVTRALRLRR